MFIGVPKEIKNSERRVALTPAGVEALVAKKHTVYVESCAGLGSNFSNEDYEKAGAAICTADQVWYESQLIVKVKEPQSSEWPHIRRRQRIFTYFHFAADHALVEAMIQRNAICIAYETVELPSGELPLLTPMSQVAGRLAVTEGAHHLDMLLGGIRGVTPASVVILGGGVVGINAAKNAVGLGASVVVLDTSQVRLNDITKEMPDVQTVLSTRDTILKHIAHADLVIGAVLVHGTKAPKLIRREDLKRMKPGAMIVDVAVDQGGCVETIYPTTHAEPVYFVDDVLHYGVTNMPGMVPRTSTLALTNATLPYVIAMADHGWKAALAQDAALLKGLNIWNGNITHRGVADAFGMPYIEPKTCL